MLEGNIISFTSVKLPHGWLGNMSPHPIEALRTTWPTCEHLFQALRFGDRRDIQDAIRAIKSPMAAKMHAKSQRAAMFTEPMSPQDLANMRFVLRAKVEQHASLRDLLVITSPHILVEDVTKRPHGSGLYWGAMRDINGTDPHGWRGTNMLGKLWMELRDKVVAQ